MLCSASSDAKGAYLLALEQRMDSVQSSPAQTASSGMDVENHATTVAFKWGCWCADDGAHVPFPDSGNDFSAHPPRVVRSVLMKHLSLGHDLILYK